MKTLLPISIEGDSNIIDEAICRMLCRVAKLARKRPTPLDIMIGPGSIHLIAALDKYYNGVHTAEETAAKLDKLFTEK